MHELYDYDALRAQRHASVSVVQPSRVALVLGSSQPENVLSQHCELERWRRRGGGGVVLVGPGDLWVDFWIPSDDSRWSADSRQAAFWVGQLWARVLERRIGDVSVHDAGLVGSPEHRLVCFAGIGPGEVIFRTRKVVGVTQWRVREGVLLSTMIASRPAVEILGCLAHVPEGLSQELRHHTTLSLGIGAELVDELLELCRPWTPGLSPQI